MLNPHIHVLILHSSIFYTFFHYIIITFNALVNCCYLCFKFFPRFKGGQIVDGYGCSYTCVCGEGVIVYLGTVQLKLLRGISLFLH